MAVTYEPIATASPSGGYYVTFSNIPQTYTDLVVIHNSSAGGADNAWMYFNDDTSGLYSLTYLQGNGSGSSAGRFLNFSSLLFSTVTAQTQRPLVAHIMNYTNTNFYKTTLIRSNDSSYGVSLQAGLYRSTDAITSITIRTQSYATLGSGTVSLYGIKAA